MSETDRSGRNEPSVDDFLKVPRESLAMRLTLDPRRTEMQDPNEIKKKLKILKSALMKERETNQENEKKLNEQSKKLQELLIDLETKETEINQLNKKINFLQVDIQSQNEQINQLKSESNKESHRSYQGSSHKKFNINRMQLLEDDHEKDAQESGAGNYLNQIGNFFGFGYPNQYMKQEVYKQMIIRVEESDKLNSQLLREKDAYEDKIKELKYQAEDMKMEQAEQVKQFEIVLKKKDQEISDLNKQMSALKQSKDQSEKQLKNTLYDNEKLKRDNNRYQSEIKQYQQELQALEIKWKYVNSSQEDLNTLIYEKDQKISSLQKEVESLRQGVSDQDQNNKSAPNQTLLSQLELQVFQLPKIGGISSQNALVILRKNVEGNYIVEIETKSEKLTIQAGEIEKVSSDPTSFSLIHKTHNQRVQHTFECKSNDVKQKFQNFIDNAPIIMPPLQDNSRKENKGLMNGLFSKIKI